MDAKRRQAHWETVYTTRGERDVSWFQEDPAASLDLIAEAGPIPNRRWSISAAALRVWWIACSIGAFGVSPSSTSRSPLLQRQGLASATKRVRPVGGFRRDQVAPRAGGVRYLARSRDFSFPHRCERPRPLCRTPAASPEARRLRHHRYVRPGWAGAMQRSSRRSLRRPGATRGDWGRLRTRLHAPPRAHDAFRRPAAFPIQLVAPSRGEAATVDARQAGLKRPLLIARSRRAAKGTIGRPSG